MALPEKPKSGNSTWVHCLIHSSILAEIGFVDRKSKKIHFFSSLDFEKVRECRSPIGTVEADTDTRSGHTPAN
jgi:hypothetical protein